MAGQKIVDLENYSLDDTFQSLTRESYGYDFLGTREQLGPAT